MTPPRRPGGPVRTTALVCPFALFGSPGTAEGAELLADALREMLADNRRERRPTRSRAYQPHVRVRELPFATPADYAAWLPRARRTARQALKAGDFLLWVGGNHLTALPVYQELAADPDALVVQFDAHLDLYHLSDCTEELSHGNFLRHAEKLPPLLNLGHRDLFLLPEQTAPYYRATFSAAELAIDPEPALKEVRRLTRRAKRVVIDLDCDAFDPAYLPAVAHPLPFGLTPPLFLRLLDAAWSDR